MRVAIDAPARRSLTSNEQRVYKLLQEGLEPSEVARRLHMALQISNLANRHDVPPDTVMGLMTSIREKGWEIPKINKEEDNMAKGQKTSPEKKDEVKTLRAEGKSQREISEITGVPQTTVHRICSECAEIKEEPAPSGNTQGSSGFFQTHKHSECRRKELSGLWQYSSARQPVQGAGCGAPRRQRAYEGPQARALALCGCQCRCTRVAVHFAGRKGDTGASL